MSARHTHAARRRHFLVAGAAGIVGTLVANGARAAAGAHRVVVIGGSLAECVYALDAQRRLVGADTTCTFPAALATLPKVGYQRALGAEGILALRPDLVLSSSEAGPPGVFGQLQRTGVRVVMVPEQHDAATVRHKIEACATALDVVPTGQRAAAAFDHAWQLAQARVATLRRRAAAPRVLFVLGHSGMQPMVAGERTAAAAMLDYAGARNALHGFNGYRPLSAEAVVSAAPELILTTTDALEAAGGIASFAAFPGLALTPAGRARRVVALDALLLLGFGPRLPQALTLLAERLHRDA